MRAHQLLHSQKIHRSQRDFRALVPEYGVLEQHHLIYSLNCQCGVENGRARCASLLAQRVNRKLIKASRVAVMSPTNLCIWHPEIL
jgi:hypothetical protein